MNKLVIAAAMALALSPAVRADVTSANVVGYQNHALTPLYNFSVSTFERVDGSAAKLGDIKCNENVSLSGTDFQLLDDNGATATIKVDGLGDVLAIFWYVPADIAEGAGIDPGWYLMYDDEVQPDYPMNDFELPFGQGYLMNCGDNDAAVIYSGAVRATDFPRELTPLYNFLGNCSPVDLTLGDFVCNENVSLSGTDLQILDDNGATDTIEVEGLGEVLAIFWYVPADIAEGAGIDPGWYLMYDDEVQPDYPMNDFPIPAGQGFLMNCGDNDAVVTIPTAL